MTVWPDPPILLKILLTWSLASVIVAWGWSRWMRYVRGDFDPPPH